MLFIVSLGLSYLLLGVSHVMRELGAHPVDRPGWTHNPSIGMLLLITLTWPVGLVVNVLGARRVAFELLSIALRLATLSFAVWAALSATASITENVPLRIVVGAVLLVLALVVLVPLLNLLMIPVSLLLAFPLDFLFPLPGKGAEKEIAWCRNCVSFRKLKSYDDAIHGAWRSPSELAPDDLPCARYHDTAAVWRAYFALSPDKRTLFPKDCPSFAPAASARRGRA